jgi:hypothetical protein
MLSLGAGHLLVLVMFVALVLDSRRLHALARSAARGRRDSTSGQRIPPGANPDRVGLPLGQIQMRHHVDWLDVGIGWEGPEILPVDEPEVAPFGADTTREAESNPALPVLWKPFPGLPAAAAGWNWPQAETPALSNPECWSGAVFDGDPCPLEQCPVSNTVVVRQSQWMRSTKASSPVLARTRAWRAVT